MSARLEPDDQKRLERFTKTLVLKTVQIIVQSRLGEKVRTYSTPRSSATDWFNLSIHDEPDVQAETKKALAGHIPNLEESTCVEISLTTVEGDTLVLETWCLGMNALSDPTVKILPTVYYRIGLMLKSLISVTRVTPAYKLSCRQGHDTYVICYKVYMGNPQYEFLGDGYEESQIGQVITPVGTLVLTVAYRTNLTITPHRSEKGCSFLVKSDHFKRDMSPRCQHRHSYDPTALYDFNEEYSQVAHDAARRRHSIGLNGSPPCLYSLNNTTQNENTKDWKLNRVAEQHLNVTESKVGAFVQCSREPDPSLLPDLVLPDTPFLSLQNDSDNNPICAKSAMVKKREKNYDDAPVDSNANMSNMGTVNRNAINNNSSKKYENLMDHNSNPHNGNYRKSLGGDGSAYDFVMVELKPSFADGSSNSDLGAFFRECQSAPPLNSFANQPSLEVQVNEIKSQLETYESNMLDFDDFVDSLCHAKSIKG